MGNSSGGFGGRELMGGNFLGVRFPGGIFLIPYLLLKSKEKK